MHVQELNRLLKNPAFYLVDLTEITFKVTYMSYFYDFDPVSLIFNKTNENIYFKFNGQIALYLWFKFHFGDIVYKWNLCTFDI